MLVRGLRLALTGGLALSILAGEAPLRRDGAYWIQTDLGSFPARGSVLRIQSCGPVSVTSDSGSDSARYTLIRRVRARSEAEARRLLDQLVLRTGPGVLSLQCPDRPAAQAEVQLRVPPARRLLQVETYSGDLSVVDFRGDVSLQTGAGAIRIDRIGGNAVLRTAGGDVRLGQVAGSVNCVSGGGSIDLESAGKESWLDTAGGEIRIGESGGPVHASTNGGNIRIGRSFASVTARTAGGRIDVEEARGIVMAGNAGGSVEVGAARGVRVEATGGGIRLRGSSGALRAMSDVGAILAELLPGMRLEDSILSTSGDITVYIPSDMALTVHALNETRRSGRIVSEFREIPVRYSGVDSTPRAWAEGELNGGGPLLKLTSSGGTIYLRRGVKR